MCAIIALFYLLTCYFFCACILIQDKCSEYIQNCIVLERKACKRDDKGHLSDLYRQLILKDWAVMNTSCIKESRERRVISI